MVWLGQVWQGAVRCGEVRQGAVRRNTVWLGRAKNDLMNKWRYDLLDWPTTWELSPAAVDEVYGPGFDDLEGWLKYATKTIVSPV